LKEPNFLLLTNNQIHVNKQKAWKKIFL
jgi:hypothetical protein